MVRQSFAVYSR